MALQKQIVALSFDKGVDTGRDPKSVIPSKFTRVENLEFDRLNSMRQRPGYSVKTLTAVSGSATVSNIQQLHALGAEVILEADSGLHAFLRNHTVSRDSGRTFERGQIDYRDVGGSQSDQYGFDCAKATTADVECWVWQEGTINFTTTYYRILDRQTRGVIAGGQLNGSGFGFNPRVVTRTSSGTCTFYLYYAVLVGADTHLKMRSFSVASGDLTPGALSSEVDVFGGVGTGLLSALGAFDAVTAVVSDKIVIGAGDTGGDTQIFTLAGSNGHTLVRSDAVTARADAAHAVSLAIVTALGTERVAMAYQVGTDFIYSYVDEVSTLSDAPFNTTITTPTTPTRLALVSNPFDATKAILFYDTDRSTDAIAFPIDVATITFDYRGIVTFGTGIVFARGLVLAARPITYTTTGGTLDVCVPVQLLSTIQPTIFMLKFGGAGITLGTAGSLKSPRVLARLFPGECGSLKTHYAENLRLPNCIPVT